MNQEFVNRSLDGNMLDPKNCTGDSSYDKDNNGFLDYVKLFFLKNFSNFRTPDEINFYTSDTRSVCFEWIVTKEFYDEDTDDYYDDDVDIVLRIKDFHIEIIYDGVMLATFKAIPSERDIRNLKEILSEHVS